MTQKGTIILETKRLILQQFTPEDFDAVHSWASNPNNVRLMLWGPNTKEETKDFINNTKPGKDFAVVLKADGNVIGSCGIYPNAANDTAEIGWILHIDHWKKGFGTELGGKLIRYGFEDMKLRRIIAESAACNYGSRRIMERNGMRHEATYIKSRWARIDKEWIDGVGYAILAEEYFNRKE